MLRLARAGTHLSPPRGKPCRGHGRYVTASASASALGGASKPVSAPAGYQPVNRAVDAARQPHAPLGDEGGEQLIEQPHDRGIAGELVRPFAHDRMDADLLAVASGSA